MENDYFERIKPCPMCNGDIEDIQLMIDNAEYIFKHDYEEKFKIQIRCYSCGFQISNEFYTDNVNNELKESCINSMLQQWNGVKTA